MSSRRAEQEIRNLESRYERLVEAQQSLRRLISELSDLAWIRHTPVSEPAVSGLIHWAQRVSKALDGNQAAQAVISGLRLRLEQSRSRIYRRGMLDRKLWCRLVADCEETACGIDLPALQWQYEALRVERGRLHKQLVNLRRLRSA